MSYHKERYETVIFSESAENPICFWFLFHTSWGKLIQETFNLSRNLKKIGTQEVASLFFNRFGKAAYDWRMNGAYRYQNAGPAAFINTYRGDTCTHPVFRHWTKEYNNVIKSKVQMHYYPSFGGTWIGLIESWNKGQKSKNCFIA